MVQSASKLVSFVVFAAFGVTNSHASTAVDIGKAEYEIIQRDSKMPVYGDCWKRALEHLEQGCKALSDDRQSRLALSFANCFLTVSGQQTYPCSDDTPVAECLKGIDNKAFAAFSQFFTHTHNMCQFLQSQVWHEKTEETIGSLTENSAKVARSIANWSEMQTSILENQAATLEYQRQIAADGTALNLALDASRESARQLMEEFRSSTDEQRALIFSIFDRVGKLQSLVVSEVSWIYSVLFYAGTLILVHVMTATKRTADARFPLLILFTLNAIVERLVCNFSLGEDANPTISNLLFPAENESVPELINARIWLCRKLSLTAAALFLAYSVYSYKDYNILNNAILRDIQAQNQELRTALQLLKVPSTGSFDAADSLDVETRAAIDDSSNRGDESDSDSDSDTTTISYSSTMTDRTWMLPIVGNGSRGHDDSFELSDQELDSEEERDFLDEFLDNSLRDNNNSGMVAEMKVIQTPSGPPGGTGSDANFSIVENVSSADNHHQMTPPAAATFGAKKRGRPRKGTPTASTAGSRGSTPLRQVLGDSPPRRRYNLRDRSLLNNTTMASPLETTGQFIKAIDEAAKLSHMNRKAVIKQVKKTKGTA